MTEVLATEVLDIKSRVISAIENMEMEDFSDFYDKIKNLMGGEETSEDGVIISPDSKIDARSWVFAYLKMDEEINFLKSQYIPALTEKYIVPVKAKIDQLETAQEYIKTGLFEFLHNIGEKKVSFPDLATIGEAKTPPKVLYPEDEDAFIKKLEEMESPYLKHKPSLDKKRILEEFKSTGELPFDDLIGESAGTTIRVYPAKSRK